MPLSIQANDHKGVIVTPFTTTEQRANGQMKVDYIGVKYRHVSIADAFARRVSHSISPDGTTFFLKTPVIDDETARRVVVEQDQPDVDNEVMAQLRAELGDEYVAALSEQVTNSSETEETPIPLGRRCFPSPIDFKQVNMIVHTETGLTDENGDPTTYAYMIIDSVWIFQVMNSERFVKRYAATGTDASLAAALQSLGITGN